VRIGPYEVTARLGEGGAGVVFAARGPAGDEVAVELLRQATPDSLARFERESRLEAELGDEAGFVPIPRGRPRGSVSSVAISIS